MDNLVEAINRLKKEKNALIMGHYYQRSEIQEIADYIGDSLALAQQAAKTKADIIVMCGVHFMGETAKVLCPEKKVWYLTWQPAVRWPTAVRPTSSSSLSRSTRAIPLFHMSTPRRLSRH